MTDPAIRRRNNGNKRRGASFEIAVVNWWRERQWASERISKKGTRDEGDCVVTLDDRESLVVEAKNAGRLSLPEWWRQAEAEAARWTEDRPGRHGWPVLIVKRRNAGIEKSWVVMSLESFERFIK